jgi:hypothetical protein
MWLCMNPRETHSIADRKCETCLDSLHDDQPGDGYSECLACGGKHWTCGNCWHNALGTFLWNSPRWAKCPTRENLIAAVIAGKDYPASHSQDQDWFAVDKCGHVGIFDSGNEGAIPTRETLVDPCTFWNDNPVEGEVTSFLRSEKGKHLTEVELWKPHSFITRAEGGPKVPIARGFYVLSEEAREWAVMYKFRESELEKEEITTDQGYTDGFLWLEGTLKEKDWKWLHDKGACLGCLRWAPFNFDSRAKLFGLFSYECESGGCFPYERKYSPEKPKTREELSKLFPVFGEKQVAVVQEKCFEDLPKIQPLERFPSVAYDDGPDMQWINEAGNAMKKFPKWK